MADLKTNLKKVLGIKKGNCIPGDKVTCPTEREYLRKKGLICPVPVEQKPAEKIPKKRQKKGWINRWFG